MSQPKLIAITNTEKSKQHDRPKLTQDIQVMTLTIISN